MSSSPALEPSSPSTTTPSSPALRPPDYPPFQTSTPNYIAKKQNHPPLNVVLPASVPFNPPTYGEPTLTPPPRSPGAAVTPATPASGDRHHPPDGTSSDKSSETAVGGISRTPSTALSRKESYKAQRQHYRREKKRAATALLHSIEDPSVVVLADWLKVRGSLKSWTKLWCVLKPGLLLLYKSSKAKVTIAKSSHWVGTVLLTSCQVIERPSKKDGFCFKLYHPLEQSIWAPRGPHNETIGAVVQPLPTAHLIFRAPSPAAGHCWLDGLELALRCSNAMLRCSRSRPEQTVPDAPTTDTNISHEELEKHFNEHVLKLSEAFPSTSPTPIMSVSDYSPKMIERKQDRKISKWAQFMESIELMSHHETTDSQAPDKDSLFTIIRREAGRNSPSTSSAKMLVEPKPYHRLTKSLASSPLKIELPKSPLLKCFEMPKLSIIDKKEKSISPGAIEENLVKLMMSLPKRRSSTPSTKVTQKRISDLRKSGAKTDSEDDKVKGSSEILCDTPDNIIIRTAPSVERVRRYSSSSTDEICAKYRRQSPYPESYTPQKYSLIDYRKLPSVSYQTCQTERRDDRFSSQNVYVAGKIVCNEELAGAASDTDSEASRPGMPEPSEPRRRLDVAQRIEALYVEDPDRETGAAGELVEEVAEENKSLLWFLLKQVRPGMDLSKVVLPTFILEPRSFLDKLSDNYYHADILAQAQHVDDPYARFKLILRWYLSGLYRKPKGLKKPYNPVLGETFRCCWKHPDGVTNTYYVAEQVSHHPPVSAFYVSNRKEGFVIEGSLLARSKFYGNSTSAILEGCARVHLLTWGETYVTTAPYAHCKGIVIGTLSMELGGKVHVMCESTGYNADIEFKLRSFLGGSEQTNSIAGRIKKGKETVATVEGYWDGRIDIRDKRSGDESTLLDVAVLKEQRLPRYLMKLENQQEFESQRLWIKVSEAIHNDDQVAATEQKTVIEEAQRTRARNILSPWVPRYFHRENNVSVPEGVVDQGWKYNHTNTSPWQPSEVFEYEEDFVITSATGSAGVIRPERMERRERSDSDSRGELATRSKTHSKDAATSAEGSGIRDEREHSARGVDFSDTDSLDGKPARSKIQMRTLKQTLYSLDTTLREQSLTLDRLTRAVENLDRRPQNMARVPSTSYNWDLFSGFVLAMVLQAVLNYMFYNK